MFEFTGKQTDGSCTWTGCGLTVTFTTLAWTVSTTLIGSMTKNDAPYDLQPFELVVNERVILRTKPYNKNDGYSIVLTLESTGRVKFFVHNKAEQEVEKMVVEGHLDPRAVA